MQTGIVSLHVPSIHVMLLTPLSLKSGWQTNITLFPCWKSLPLLRPFGGAPGSEQFSVVVSQNEKNVPSIPSIFTNVLNCDRLFVSQKLAERSNAKIENRTSTFCCEWRGTRLASFCLQLNDYTVFNSHVKGKYLSPFQSFR